jgi:FecR protein
VQRRDFIKRLAALCGLPVAILLPELLPVAARAQGTTGPAAPTAPDSAEAEAADIGQVATLQGNATLMRAQAAAVALRVNDAIFKNDIIATGDNSMLGITFDDQTTFSLSPNTRIVVNEFVYEADGSGNAAAFNVAAGTAAFVASLVAKTGDMKITTANATLGIRGTTGVVEVPQNAAGGEPHIKLYADADGHVGRIDVFDRQGGRLGDLTANGSAFSIARGPGGRIRAVPFQIPPEEAARDRGVLQRLFSAHTIGRRLTASRLRARGRNRTRPNNQHPGGRGQQPSNRNPHAQETHGGSPRGPGGQQHGPQGGQPRGASSPHSGTSPRGGGSRGGGGGKRGERR